MPDENRTTMPDRDSPGFRRAEEVAGEVKVLDQRLSSFQQSVAETNNRFGARIGKLEARNDVQDEQRIQMKEQIAEVKADVAEFRKEQKDSISELRRETKESMEELRRGNKEILDAVTPLAHKVESHDASIKAVNGDVDKLKEKPGKTWEDIKGKLLALSLALIFAIVIAALGLSQFT